MLNKNSDLNYFNLSIFFHFIGRLMYRIFVPIVLLKNGFSLDNIFQYLIGYCIITILVLILSLKFFSNKKVIVFNVLAILSEIFLILLFLPDKISFYLLILIILFEGIYYSLYYISYYSIITHLTTIQKTWSNLWNIEIISKFAWIITPIFWALILDISKPLFFMTALAFLLLSILPLISITKCDINGEHLPKISIKKIWRELISSTIVYGIEFSIFVLWSIYIYINWAPLLYIGFIPAIWYLVDILLIFLIKKRLSNLSIRIYIKYIGIIWIILLSIYRYILPEHIIFTTLLIALFYTLFNLSIKTDIIEKFQGYQTFYSSMLMQICWFCLMLLIWIITYAIWLEYMILAPVGFGLMWIFKEIFFFLFDKKIISWLMILNR